MGNAKQQFIESLQSRIDCRRRAVECESIPEHKRTVYENEIYTISKIMQEYIQLMGE